MAKRGARGGASRTTRSRRDTGAAPAPVEVEVVEEAGGNGIDAGIAIGTFIMLLLAILFVDAHLGHYDGGIFF